MTLRRRRALLSRAHKERQHGRVVGRAESSDRVPALRHLETARATARVVANGNVVEHFWVGVEHGVDEADGGLACRDELVVDARQDTGEGGRGSTGSADERWGALVEDDCRFC